MKRSLRIPEKYEDIALMFPFVCAEESDLAKECEPAKWVKRSKILQRLSKDDSSVNFSDTD
jgi:hypothetical protein